MSTWINVEYVVRGLSRGRVFLIAEKTLKEHDIHLSSYANPRFMGEMAEATLKRLSEIYPTAVPPGSICIGLRWCVYAWSWEFVFLHPSLPVVEEGEEFPKITLNWRNEDGTLEWRPE